ncbi:hypothetical protein LCGC14_1020710 [marine sediment metagenome]|uniref:Uncharacterized protein n=1 Tax=marine sediment metagenome TaxID=412755 RepID=A0A0F9R3E0_9ZZZZ
MTLWVIGALFTLGFVFDAKPKPSVWKFLAVVAIWPIALGVMLRSAFEQGIELSVKAKEGKNESKESEKPDNSTG